MDSVNDMELFDREWAKMLDGEVYDAVHPEFLRRLVDNPPQTLAVQ